MCSQETTLKNFTCIQKLGSGSFATVYKVQRLDDQQFYAMKKVKIGEMREKEKENALNQVRILASINHPNIVNYKEAFFDSNSQTLCVVMEYANAGDIQKKINKHLTDRTHFTEKQIWKALIQMAKGLKALHEINIFHRDLKCANVFCNSDGKYKLGDLNVSKVAKRGMAKTQTGTPYYTSPEVWKDRPYDSKCDIWSLGCVIYEMASLRPPFRASNMKELYAKIQRGIFQRTPAFYSEDLYNIVSIMLKVNPVSRPSAAQLLQHSIIKTNMPSQEFYNQNVQQTYKASLLRTIQVPKNLLSLKQALPKSKYVTERPNSSKQRERIESQQPSYVSERRYNRNNSVQLLKQQIPRVVQTPKNKDQEKQNKYMFRRPVSSGHRQVLGSKEAKSQMRQDIKKQAPQISRMSRNNSVDSIQKKVEKSIEKIEKCRIERVNSGKCIIPSENYNYHNINNNRSNVVKNIDQRVQKIMEKIGSRPSSSREKQRVYSREKTESNNQMVDISNKCKQIEQKVNGILNKKRQASNNLLLPNILQKRPKISIPIPRVDSRNRLLSGNCQPSNAYVRQKSFERPPSRQKSIERVNVNSNVNKSIDKSNDRSLQRNNSRKRYLYQQASPRIR